MEMAAEGEAATEAEAAKGAEEEPTEKQRLGRGTRNNFLMVWSSPNNKDTPAF